MGLFSFIKEAGEKLFGGKEVEAAAAQAASNPAPLQDLNDKAARAIEAYIASQNLGVQGVQVAFDGASGKVVVQGQAPTQEAKEKVTLCCGNVASVKDVDNLMAVSAPSPEEAMKVDLGEPLFVGRERVAEAFERKYLSAALKQTGGNVSRAAEIAGVNRKFIQRAMKRFGTF